MPFFRKKPMVIEAYIWTPESEETVTQWLTRCGCLFRQEGVYIFIETLEGAMRADSGDYIIRGVKGEFYPCKPDIFEATYDLEV